MTQSSNESAPAGRQPAIHRQGPPLIYAAVIVVLLVTFALTGGNRILNIVYLLAVPIASGILTELRRIRIWHAVAGCLAVVTLDVVFDDRRGEGALFAVLSLVMLGIATLTQWLTRLIRRRSST